MLPASLQTTHQLCIQTSVKLKFSFNSISTKILLRYTYINQTQHKKNLLRECIYRIKICISTHKKINKNWISVFTWKSYPKDHDNPYLD